MDRLNVDHNDSDSGESWTILENTAVYAEDAPEFPNERHLAVNNEKDEDTDGISIISDSDHESAILPKNIHESYITEEQTEKQTSTHISVSPYITNVNDNIKLNKSVRVEDDFLVDSNGKLKTYVHRRNKRLSTVLNIIMLGSVITAAGVAIGHMWGAKNDCTLHSAPSVNKILSNLYKLQEENAYLRNKLKELTLLSNFQMQQQKMPLKQQRCKKIFEEPLHNKNANRLTKCLDGKNNENEKFLNSNLVEEPLFEKEFLSDINKLKNVYQQNKSWLDKEISKRLRHEEQQVKGIKKFEKITKPNKLNDDNKMLMIDVNKLPLIEEKVNLFVTLQDVHSPDSKFEELPTDKKISYADSLKTEQQNGNIKKRDIYEKSEFTENSKKFKERHDPETVISEEEIKKDDRYNCQRVKKDKWRKKQKRKNRHEQYKLQLLNDEPKHKIEILDNFKDHPHIVGQVKSNEMSNDKKNLPNWYEKRAKFRKDSRKKLEQELFGEVSQNDSGWYFRRMKRREQCRAKANNATHKQGSKLNMNFKSKY